MILYLLPCISFDANTFDICVSPPPNKFAEFNSTGKLSKKTKWYWIMKDCSTAQLYILLSMQFLTILTILSEIHLHLQQQKTYFKILYIVANKVRTLMYYEG